MPWVWGLEHRQLVSSFQCETNITAFAIIHGTSLMYIGDDNGMLSVLKYDSEVGKLLRLPYNIPTKSIFESAGISCPIHQSVVGVLPQPSSSGTRVLIAYENGLMILWDVSESHVITIRGYTDLQLKDEDTNSDSQNEGGDEQEGNEICSLCWVSSSGSILAVGYINGDILLWDLSSDLSKKRQSTSSSSKAVVKLQLASGNRRLPVIVLNWSANTIASDKGGQLLIYGGDDVRNFTHAADPTHASGFFPMGASGVFYGAARVYLSYIGYDVVSTMAEEVKNPIRDIPIGVSGSVVIVTVLYCLMAASMSMLVPYDAIDINSPFSAAFRRSFSWVSNVIGVGASFEILTSLLVAMLGQARYLCVIGRSNVVPGWFAKINSKTSTPVNASVFLRKLNIFYFIVF